MTKFTGFIILVVVHILVIPNTVLGQDITNKDSNSVVGFRTVYSINLNQVEDEAEFVVIAEVFNKLVAELGYQNISFSFWKVTGDIEGPYKYIFESTWPDQETFDKVFKNEKFKVTLNSWYPIFQKMIAEGNYNRYILLN